MMPPELRPLYGRVVVEFLRRYPGETPLPWPETTDPNEVVAIIREMVGRVNAPCNLKGPVG